MAKRPFWTSRRSFLAFSSSDKSLVNPKGSKRGNGVNGFVTIVLKAGNCPGLPPLM
eukprot:CAMPEP_0169218124 /NCGR_PEP_ID=MMETSP1016-20121227/19270_1 /TAXON_ID=342587 /ORGANISM="Karlodinium micrum, Strain CCMP2283" /LENGTH=55 /DNA_ID=CAMNT_0009296089 /DNA_START=44 /DNA_END=211 /DNA_ORIENTATION=-